MRPSAPGGVAVEIPDYSVQTAVAACKAQNPGEEWGGGGSPLSVEVWGRNLLMLLGPET